MKLHEYIVHEVSRRNKEIDKQNKKREEGAVEEPKTTKTAVLRELSAKAKVSLLTLQGVERGATMRLYDKAKAVSEATGGKVRIIDICE